MYVESLVVMLVLQLARQCLHGMKLVKAKLYYPFADSLYLGPLTQYDNVEIENTADKYNATLEKVEIEDVVKLMIDKNIVAMFQGRSEAGPKSTW